MNARKLKKVVKAWIAHLFRIRTCYNVFFKSEDGRKIAVFVLTNENGKNVKAYRFLVEHLLDYELKVTEQTLKQEDDLFI